MKKIAPGIIWLILWILSWFPGFILQFLTYLIHVVIFTFSRYRLDVVNNNLRKAFPGMGDPEISKIAGRFTRHFSELFLEMVLLLRYKPRTGSNRIRFSNPEVIDQAYRQNKNIIIMTGHYGNWEWNVLPILAAGYRVLGVYKPQTSKLADQLMKFMRQKPGIVLVTMKDTLRVIKKEMQAENSPFALILVADQIPARGDIHFWSRFLNQDSAFFTGGEKLAKKLGLPVFYVDQEKRRFARYTAKMEIIYDGKSPSPDGEITNAFSQRLESSIRRDPYLWLWSHRRWKYRREELPLRI